MTAELRAYITTRPAWEFRLWFGCLAVAFGIIALAAIPVALWGWLLGAVTVATCAGLAAWALDLRRDLRDARAESVAILAQAELLADELNHADKTIRNLAAQVASNVIPLQRQNGDDPYTWPALAREIEHDDLTALTRATEEK